MEPPRLHVCLSVERLVPEPELPQAQGRGGGALHVCLEPRSRNCVSSSGAPHEQKGPRLEERLPQSPFRDAFVVQQKARGTLVGLGVSRRLQAGLRMGSVLRGCFSLRSCV